MIYFDHAASTKTKEELFDVYKKAVFDLYSNPSSPHHLASKSQRVFEQCNLRILDLLKLDEKSYEVIHTSGATEANNLAIIGYALKVKNRGQHIICLSSEHPSTLEAYRHLESAHGFKVSYLDLLKDGSINLDLLEKTITPQTILVSVGLVNSEIGMVNDIKRISKIIDESPLIRLHVDLVQGIGRIPLFDLNLASFLTISLHKLGGVKGHGLLIKRRKAQIVPIVHGGGQQDNYRSGTLDVPAAIMFTKAVELALTDEVKYFSKINVIATRIKEHINNNPLLHLNSSQMCSPYIVNFSLNKHKGSVVLEALSKQDIHVSSTSACASKKNAQSATLKSMGLPPQLSENSLRISLSYENTLDEVEMFFKTLDAILKKVKENG